MGAGEADAVRHVLLVVASHITKTPGVV
jgi:hypothetical protein